MSRKINKKKSEHCTLYNVHSIRILNRKKKGLKPRIVIYCWWKLALNPLHNSLNLWSIKIISILHRNIFENSSNPLIFRTIRHSSYFQSKICSINHYEFRQNIEVTMQFHISVLYLAHCRHLRYIFFFYS